MVNTLVQTNKNSFTVTIKLPKHISIAIDYVHEVLCNKHKNLTANQKATLKLTIEDLVFNLIKDAQENESLKQKIDVPSISYSKYTYRYKYNNKMYTITYTQMLEILASPECAFLLPRSNSYCPGKFPKFVHLNKWCTEKETSENLEWFKRTIRRKSSKIDKNVLKNHKNIIKNLKSIKIDVNGYLEYLSTNKPKEYTLEVLSKNVVPIYPTYFSIFYKLDLAINYILENFYVSDGKVKTGRLYTSFSGLPSDLMPYITYRGKKLIERDAANFGPATIGMLTGNKYVIEAASQGKFYDNIGEVIFLDYHKRIEEGTPDENNTTFYNNIVKLSKNILKKNGKPLIVDRKFTREFAKLQSFGSLLYVKTPYKTGRFANIINEVYPGLIEDIENLQKELKENNLSFDTLAAKVQSIEANIFVKPFEKQNKFYLTKHDSIFFSEEDIEYFENKLKENLENSGVKTKLK